MPLLMGTLILETLQSDPRKNSVCWLPPKYAKHYHFGNVFQNGVAPQVSGTHSLETGMHWGKFLIPMLVIHGAFSGGGKINAKQEETVVLVYQSIRVECKSSWI